MYVVYNDHDDDDHDHACIAKQFSHHNKCLLFQGSSMTLVSFLHKLRAKESKGTWRCVWTWWIPQFMANFAKPSNNHQWWFITICKITGLMVNIVINHQICKTLVLEKPTWLVKLHECLLLEKWVSKPSMCRKVSEDQTLNHPSMAACDHGNSGNVLGIPSSWDPASRLQWLR